MLVVLDIGFGAACATAGTPAIPALAKTAASDCGGRFSGGSTFNVFLFNAIEEEWSMPAVLRIDGLSACGLNFSTAVGAVGLLLPSKASATLAEKNAAVTGPGGACGGGGGTKCWDATPGEDEREVIPGS